MLAPRATRPVTLFETSGRVRHPTRRYSRARHAPSRRCFWSTAWLIGARRRLIERRLIVAPCGRAAPAPAAPSRHPYYEGDRNDRDEGPRVGPVVGATSKVHSEHWLQSKRERRGARDSYQIYRKAFRARRRLWSWLRGRKPVRLGYISSEPTCLESRAWSCSRTKVKLGWSPGSR